MVDSLLFLPTCRHRTEMSILSTYSLLFAEHYTGHIGHSRVK